MVNYVSHTDVGCYVVIVNGDWAPLEVCSGRAGVCCGSTFASPAGDGYIELVERMKNLVLFYLLTQSGPVGNFTWASKLKVGGWVVK